ncbi:MAG: hypothetical protein ACPGVG_05670 [Mycobacterium sp.]
MATLPLDSCAKTSLAAMNRQLNISAADIAAETYDDKIIEIVNAVSAKITTMLNGREVCAKDYVAWMDGQGADEFVVPQFPIIRVNVLATGCAKAMTVQYTGSNARATAQVTAEGLLLTSWGTSGATAVSKAWADFETIGELVTEINDNIADWTAVLTADGPSKWLRPAGGRDAKTSAMALDYPDDIGHEFEAKYDTGLIQFRGRGSGAMRPTDGMGLGGTHLAGETPLGGLRVMLDYRAGFETTPADIEQVAREMTAEVFDLSYRDGSVKSESLGGYSYTLVDTVATSGRWADVLARYEREVLA